jgi:hypothetical protein
MAVLRKTNSPADDLHCVTPSSRPLASLCTLNWSVIVADGDLARVLIWLAEAASRAAGHDRMESWERMRNNRQEEDSGETGLRDKRTEGEGPQPGMRVGKAAF